MPRETEISPEQMRRMESPLEQSTQDAIVDTQREIFRSAFHDDEDLDGEVQPDDDNDRSLEQPENIEGVPQDDLTGEGDDPDDEPEAVAEEDEAEPEGEPEGEPEVSQQRDQRIPLTRLQEEATRRRELETRAREQEAELNRLRGEMEAMRRQQMPPQQPVAPQTRPDPILDPDGARRYDIVQDRNDRIVRHINYAERDPETGWQVTEAGKWAIQNLGLHDPQRRQQLFEYLDGAPDPGNALVKLWQQQGGGGEKLQQLQREREQREFEEWARKADRFGYEIPAARRQSQSSNGIPPRSAAPPRHVTQLPKSLNSAGGRRSQPEDPSLYDESMASYSDYAFGDRRQK